MEIKDQIVAQIREAIELGKALDAKLVKINESFEDIKSIKVNNPETTFEEAKDRVMEYVHINQMAALYIQDINHISSILTTLYPLVKIGEIDLNLSAEDSMLFEGIGSSSKYFFKSESGNVVEVNEEIILQFKEQTQKALNEDSLRQIFSKL
jgi:hypothetical protein